MSYARQSSTYCPDCPLGYCSASCSRAQVAIGPAAQSWLIRHAGALIMIAMVAAVFMTIQSNGQLGAPHGPLTDIVTPRATATPQPTSTPEVGAEMLNQYGKDALARGEYDKATTLFNAAIIAAPGFYEPYNNLAFVRYEQGQGDEAIRLWQEALRLWPDSPDANAGLGMALTARGQLDEGRRYYQRALDRELGYADATWMRQERLWGARAIMSSAPLR